MNLDIAGMAEPTIGAHDLDSAAGLIGLNQVHLRSGRHIEPDREGEVLGSEVFVQAHRLQPGDNVTAMINGRRANMRNPFPEGG